MGIFWGKKIHLIFFGWYVVFFHSLHGEVRKADVVIYGGIPCLSSAVQVKRMGKTVLVVSPDFTGRRAGLDGRIVEKRGNCG